MEWWVMPQSNQIRLSRWLETRGDKDRIGDLDQNKKAER